MSIKSLSCFLKCLPARIFEYLDLCLLRPLAEFEGYKAGLNLTFMSLVIFASIFSIRTAQAIVNTEELRARPTEKPIIGSLSLKANGQSGNTDKKAMSLDQALLWSKDLNQIIFSLSYFYGESMGKKDANSGFTHLRYVRRIAEEWEAEGFSQLEFNEFQRLSSRYLLGAGLRYRWYESPLVRLFQGAGAFYSQERLDQEGSDQKLLYEYARWNQYLSLWHEVSSRMSLQLVVYYQPRVDLISDFHLAGDLSFNLSLSEAWDFLIEYSFRHDSKPPTGVSASDAKYLAGLSWSY